MASGEIQSEPESQNPHSDPLQDQAAGIDPSLEVCVYTPDSSLRNPRKLARDIAHDLWAGRELSWRMFLRNIRGLYRQTFLGLFWAFLPPLANTAVWVILRQANAIDLAGGMEVSYVVYVMTGMVIWQSFIEAFQAPLQAVQANRGLLSKLKFPRESILLVKFFEILFNLGVRLIVLLPILMFMGANLSLWIAVAPVFILLLIMLGMAMGLFLMPFGMLYQDVGRLMLLAIPIWMILTPIVYAAPKGWASNPLNYLNPASPFLSVARDLIVFGQTDVWNSAMVYAAITLPLLVIGLLVYRLSIPILVERVST